MAFKNIEIEKKYEINKREFNKLKDLLFDITSFKSDSTHIDEYFSTQQVNIEDNAPPIKWISIRHRNGKHILNYKRYIPLGEPNYTHSKEYESILDNPIVLSKVLIDFGFNIIVTIKKRRIELVFKDLYVLSLDEVEGLGCFVEIEALKMQNTIEETNEQITTFANELGLLEDNRVNLGYPIQLLRKNK